jgi:hypothetical protein
MRRFTIPKCSCAIPMGSWPERRAPDDRRPVCASDPGIFEFIREMIYFLDTHNFLHL